jgi:coenzyme F420-reducing hydrogenase gamma subunit
MVAHGTPCLGPVTHAGCGAICPTYHRGCYGCFGPMETPNTEALGTWLRQRGMTDPDLVRTFRGFNGYAESFRRESERHEQQDQDHKS